MIATNVPRYANRLNAGTSGTRNRDALPLDRASLILEVVALGYQFLARELRVVRNRRAVLGDLDVGNAARVPLLLRIWVATWVLTHNAVLDLDQFAYVDRPYRQRIRAGQRLEIGQDVDAAVIRDVVTLGRNVWRVGDTQRNQIADAELNAVRSLSAIRGAAIVVEVVLALEGVPQHAGVAATRNRRECAHATMTMQRARMNKRITCQPSWWRDTNQRRTQWQLRQGRTKDYRGNLRSLRGSCLCLSSCLCFSECRIEHRVLCAHCCNVLSIPFGSIGV